MARKDSNKTTEPKALDAAVALMDQPVISKTELDQITTEMSSLIEDHPLQEKAYTTTQVVTSPVRLPDAASLQATMATMSANQASIASDKGMSLGDSKLDNAYAQSINELESAIRHTQKVQSSATNVNRNGSTVVMPPEVRDIPNSLYWYVDNHRQYFYVRQKADKLLFGMFGEDLGHSVMRVAASCNFYKDPLVWVSQVLWTHIHLDVPHDYDSMDAPAFNATIDENADSKLIMVLNQCFNHFEVRGLSKLARYHNKSILAILRKIFLDVMAEHKMPVPPPAPVAPITGPTND